MERWKSIPTITPGELKEILEILKKMSNPPALMIFGPPGIGKTTILEDFARKNGYDLRVQHLSRMDPSDFSGIPVPVEDENTKSPAFTRFLPPYFLRPPEKDEKGNRKRIVIFFDELNTAMPQVQNAALDILLEKKLDNIELPKDTIMVAAGNLGIEDGTFVEELSMAVKTRLLQFIMVQDIGDWIEWAEANGIVECVRQFIKENEDYLVHMEGLAQRRQQVATPRGWERVSDIIKASGHDRWFNIEWVKKMIYGAVGQEAGKRFIEFARNRVRGESPETLRVKQILKTRTFSDLGMDEFLNIKDELFREVDRLVARGYDRWCRLLVEKFLKDLDSGFLKSIFQNVSYPHLMKYIENHYPGVYRKINS